jgi:hypothetical protein
MVNGLSEIDIEPLVLKKRKTPLVLKKRKSTTGTLRGSASSGARHYT